MRFAPLRIAALLLALATPATFACPSARAETVRLVAQLAAAPRGERPRCATRRRGWPCTA